MGEMRMPTVGAGFHARPASVKGRRRLTRTKWCAGCARGIEYVWKRTSPCALLETQLQAVTPNVRNERASVKIGCRAEPTFSVDRRTAHRGRCALRRET